LKNLKLKLYIFFAFIIAFKTTRAQIGVFYNDSLILYQLTWTNYPYQGPLNPGGTSYTSVYSFINGDSLIGLKTYKKFYSYSTPGGPMSYTSFGACSLVFSDSDKVYRYYSTGNELIHDYNLAVGDSFYFKYYGKSKLLSIDSQLVNSIYLKRFNFQNGVKWLKGIGDIVFGAQWNANAYGFFNPGPFGITFGSAFKCWSEKKQALLGTGCNMTLCNGILPLVTSTSSSLICSSETASLSVNGASTYTWSTGENSFQIVVTPSITTNYTVNATTSSGCVLSSILTQSVDACIGIKEYQQSKLRIYPNPVSCTLNILVSSKAIENSQLEIINYLGQTFLKTDYTNTIDVSKLKQGIYTLKIITKDNQSYYSKFIKE
jgi:hypothetical protein